MDKNLLITQILIVVTALGFWFFTHLENKNQIEKAKVELEILKLKNDTKHLDSTKDLK